MKHYFIHDGKNQHGPFTLDQLKTKTLKNDTPVWFVGLGKWTTAEKVEELQPLLAGAPLPYYNLTAPASIATIAASDSRFGAATTKNLARNPFFWGVLLVSVILGWFIYQFQQQNLVLNNAQQTEQEKQRTENERLKKTRDYRNNWTRYIGLSGTTYKTNKGGGNDSFDVYVQNNTASGIDQVQLSVNYLREPGKVLKTETVTLFNIPAHSEKAVRAPDSEKGSSITTKITGIRCAAMNFCFPQTNGNTADPYFCN